VDNADEQEGLGGGKKSQDKRDKQGRGAKAGEGADESGEEGGEDEKQKGHRLNVDRN